MLNHCVLSSVGSIRLWRPAGQVPVLLCVLWLSGQVSAQALVEDAAPSAIQAVLAEKNLPDDIQALYASRGYRPLWFDQGRPAGDTREVAVRVASAEAEGLRRDDYRLPEVLNGDAGAEGLSPRQMMEADLAFTQTVMRYASDLRDGRFRADSMDRKWDIRKQKLDAATWLSTAMAAGELGPALDRLAPEHPVYQNLRRALREYSELKTAGGWPAFPANGPRKLEPGVRHEQVVMLRQRLAITDGPLPDTLEPNLFDPDLEEAVKRFQRRHALNDDGVVGRRTRAALGVPIDQRIAQLRVALERWRWMPRGPGSSYVLVNVPAYRLWFYDDGEPVLTMRTIVGKYKRQTPTFAASISYFVLRPKWYVPNKIAVKDLVPKAQKDPEYYQRGGYVIYEKETGQTVDPANVDWSVHGYGKPFPYRLVQGAGATNALGDIKFMFKNPYGVYLHDTSSPRLFAKDSRAFSSGCIRVQEPLTLASRILSEAQPTSPEAVGEMIRRAPKNRHLTLSEEIPLYVVYLTAWADDQTAYFYDDVYRRDRKLLDALAN